jgi:hypothetical protein
LSELRRKGHSDRRTLHEERARTPPDRGIMSSPFFGDVFNLESRPRLEPGAQDKQELIQERDHRTTIDLITLPLQAHELCRLIALVDPLVLLAQPLPPAAPTAAEYS